MYPCVLVTCTVIHTHFVSWLWKEINVLFKDSYSTSFSTSFSCCVQLSFTFCMTNCHSHYVVAPFNMISEAIDTWINSISASGRNIDPMEKSNCYTYRYCKDLQLIKDSPGNLFNLFMLNALTRNRIENSFIIDVDAKVPLKQNWKAMRVSVNVLSKRKQLITRTAGWWGFAKANNNGRNSWRTGQRRTLVDIFIKLVWSSISWFRWSQWGIWSLGRGRRMRGLP